MLTKQTIDFDVSVSHLTAFYDSDVTCPFCDSTYISLFDNGGTVEYICPECGNVWVVLGAGEE